MVIEYVALDSRCGGGWASFACRYCGHTETARRNGRSSPPANAAFAERTADVRESVTQHVKERHYAWLMKDRMDDLLQDTERDIKAGRLVDWASDPRAVEYRALMCEWWTLKPDAYTEAIPRIDIPRKDYFRPATVARNLLRQIDAAVNYHRRDQDWEQLPLLAVKAARAVRKLRPDLFEAA